jgi:1-acyl-sn-glycerol-3-phosphate acyltransferase
MRFYKHYYFLKGMIRLLLRLFYRKVQVHGYDEHVKPGAPVIWAANHQNAFIDALNVVTTTRRDRQPHFMTRADIFTGIADKLMRWIKMLPIYRQRDGADFKEKNEEIFDLCVSRLSNNDSMIIFAEGNHGRKQALRPLKKGLARIGFQTAEALGYQDSVYVVPTGLTYEDHLKMRSDFLISYGPPLDLAEYYEAYQAAPMRTIVTVMQDLRERLEGEMIHISSREYYDLIEPARRIFRPRMLAATGRYEGNLRHHLEVDQETIRRMEAALADGRLDGPKLLDHMSKFQQGLQALKLRLHVVQGAPYGLGRLLLQGVGLVLGAPLFLYGLVNNYLPYKIPDVLALKLFKDDHFHSSIRVLGALLTFPLFYLLQSLLVWALSDWKLALLYLISLPVTGEFAYRFSNWAKKWWARWRFMAMRRRKDARLVGLEAAYQALMAAWPVIDPQQERVATPPAKSSGGGGD